MGRSKSVAEAGTVAAIYARYSSHNQKDASIEQQVRECQAYAKEHNITVIGIYSDHAVTGRTDKRQQFQKLLKDAEAGKFQAVIAWKSNRIGRNMMQAMVNEARLNDAGVRCLYTEEDFDDTAAGRFALRSMMNVNQFYSENMAEDIRRGLEDNARKALCNGSLPFGIKKGPDGKCALDPPRSDIVREIFLRVDAGENYVDIINSLNARGITTRTGRKFSQSAVHRILSNERYTGVYIYGNIRVDDGMPQIIEPNLFFRVQSIMANINKVKGRSSDNMNYVLTGKLFCGHCKRPMVGISGKGKMGVMYYYYACQGKRLEKICTKRNVQKDPTEAMVAQAVVDHILTDEVIEWIADQTVAYNQKAEASSDVGLLTSELNDTQAAINNVMKAIEMGIITPTTKDRLTELETKKEELRCKLAEARSQFFSVSKEEIIAGLELFREGDVSSPEYQAKLIDTFVTAVYLYDDVFKIVFGFAGNRSVVTVPFSADDVDALPDPAGLGPGLYRESFGAPSVTGTNSTFDAVFEVFPHKSALFAMKGMFVLVYRVK